MKAKISKAKIWIIVAAVVVVLAVLFVPYSYETYLDGGTREYTSLTYKIMHWNVLMADENGEAENYDKLRVYFGEDRVKSYAELWEAEMDKADFTKSFVAWVTEVENDTVIVEPVNYDYYAGPIFFNIKDQELPAVGCTVRVYFKGEIRETDPAQIELLKLEILDSDDNSDDNTEEWLDKSTAIKLDEGLIEDEIEIYIEKIDSNCFYAHHSLGDTTSHTKIKINGALGEEWCVGDTARITYKNAYIDSASQTTDVVMKMECDLVSIAPITFEDVISEDNLDRKPVIYLYPEEETEVFVGLELNGVLTCSYPAYNNGWSITASPDGTLTDACGQTYNYLYWEGITQNEWDLSQGFCVRGEDTAAFLEEALSRLGLTRREANEFIVYWLPLMQDNAYNIISFQGEAYTSAAKLDISPAPDTLIRVFMTYRPSDSFVEIPPQELTAPERTGFTAVEWGGAELR